MSTQSDLPQTQKDLAKEKETPKNEAPTPPSSPPPSDSSPKSDVVAPKESQVIEQASVAAASPATSQPTGDSLVQKESSVTEQTSSVAPPSAAPASASPPPVQNETVAPPEPQFTSTTPPQVAPAGTVIAEKTIVAIEDDPYIGELLTIVLASPLLNVTHCSDGEEGLAMVRQIHPDLLITDVMLPLLNGWQVYDAVRSDESEAVKNTRILMLSVTRQELERQRAFRGSTIDFYMNKPFDPRTLRRKVEEILGTQFWKDTTKFT